MKLFIERGFSACSVQDITEAAGVPKGSFYNHFKSKEALAAEILTQYGEGNTDRSILTNPDVPALIRLKKHFAALNEYFSRCNGDNSERRRELTISPFMGQLHTAGS